jgi:hypothetical protein
MSQTCPVPTPEQRRFAELQSQTEQELWQRVQAALRDAADQARAAAADAGLALPPPPYDYFAAVVHQRLYCTLCGADPDTFTGGRADTAAAILRNGRQIAEHYWDMKKT